MATTVTELGKVEDEIFKRRRETELDFKRRQKEKRKRQKLVSLLLQYLCACTFQDLFMSVYCKYVHECIPLFSTCEPNYRQTSTELLGGSAVVSLLQE